MEENQNLVELYNALHKKGVTAASNVSEFKMLLDDEKNRQDMYDALNKKGVFSGTYDEFQTSIGYELNQQPAPARVDVSDVEDETIVRTEQPENYVEMPKQDARQSKYPFPSYYPQYRNDDANPSVEQKVKDDGFVVPSELTEENFKSVKQRRDELNKRLEEIGKSAQHLGQMGFMAPKEPLNALSEEAKKIRSELETIDGFIDSWNNTDESRAYLERQKQRVNDVSLSIDKAQEENNRNRINRQIERDSKLTFFGRLAKSLQAAENPITPEVVEALTDPTTNGLRAAKNEVRNADKQLQLEDMRRNGEMKGLAFIRGLETANYYELIPAIGMADALAILDAKQALEEGRELNQSQQLLLEAMEARAEVDNAYQDNNTIWERLGKSAPEQLMFTAQFVVGAGVTGATKVGERVAAKSAERAAVKYAKKGVKSSARRFVGGTVLPKLEGMAVSSAMQTFANPLGVAGMVEDFERRYAGDIYYDNEGNLHVFDNDRGAGKAAYQAIASAWIENFTEYAGENITKSAKLLDSKMFDIAGKFDNVIKRVGAGKIADVFSIPKQLGQITQIGSAPEEFLEEELGSVMNALFATDAESGESYGDSFKRTIGQSFSGEQQLETLLSCTITSMLLGGGGNAVNAVGNAGRRKQANRDVEESKALLGKVTGINIDELDIQIENGEIKDIASYLKRQSDANGWNQDEQGAAVSYVMNRTRQIGMRHFDDTAIAEAQQEMRRQAEDMANRWDGNIYNATWKDGDGNEQPVTIVNGRVHYNTRENGTIHFDPYTSSAMFAIRLADGTMKQVPSRTITGIQAVNSIDAQLQSQGQTIPQMMRSQFEQEGIAIPTLESVWGGNLVANETQFDNGKYTYLGQDENGRYAFANNDKRTNKDNPIVYKTERQLIEYGLSLNIQAANAAGDAETARQAQDEIDFMQHLDEITADATEKEQWDVVKSYAKQKVAFDENGEMDADDSNVRAAAAYLLALSEGSFENAISSIDESVAALAAQQVQQQQSTDISTDAAANAEASAAAGSVDAAVSAKVDFYHSVRNSLLEMRDGQQEAKEEAASETPVSQMEPGTRFEVKWNGEAAVAEVDWKDESGRSVVNVMDAEGNDLQRGIDDMTDDQWEDLRVKPQENLTVRWPNGKEISIGDNVEFESGNEDVGYTTHRGEVVEISDDNIIVRTGSDDEYVCPIGNIGSTVRLSEEVGNTPAQQSEAETEDEKDKPNAYNPIDPRAMSEEEKQTRGEKLNTANAIEVAANQIVSSEGMSARKAAEAWWDSNVTAPLFYDTEVGEVEINRNSVESSLAHRYSQAKLDAITSLPEGFANAVYLGTMPDSKRQDGVMNHYFAYPIMYNGERCYVFCRALHDNNTNRLYVHEVFVGENIKKGDTLQTAASQPHGGIALYRDILANVLDSGGKDNTKSGSDAGEGEKNTLKRDKDGNIDHSSLNPDDANAYAEAVSEEADNSEAFAGMGDPDYIKRNLDAAGKEVEKAEKRKPKATNASKLRDELSEINRQKQSAKAMVAFWNAVDAERKRRQAERIAARQAADDDRREKALAEEEARKAENARKKAEQEQLGANNVSDNIREKWNNSTKIEGNADEITLANGERIEGHYYLVESGSASASHDATEGFKKTEGFPVDENGQTVNDRDYEGDMNAQQITRTMAQNYDSRAAQEAPVVSQDGIVMSGNGRTMAGELAALNNTDGAYIEYLNKYPHKYGFTTEQVGGMSHPRVVFVPNERMPYTTDTFAKFNQQGMKGQSKTEQAVKLGKIVDDATFGRIIRSINRFDTLGDFYADSNATAEAIGELQKAGAINQMQHTEMFDGETISETGKQMLENMLIGKAFESNPDAVRQLAAYKSLRQSVITALAEISNNIALGEYSLESELSQAIELAYNARSKGYKAGDKVSEFAGQTVLFAEDGATAADFTNATVMMLADLLNDNRVTRLKKALQVYNGNASESAAGQIDLFSGDVKTKEQILDEVLLLLQNGTEQEQQEALDKAREQRKAEAGIQQDGDAGELNPTDEREAELVSATTETIASQAEIVASQAESDAENITTEQQGNEIAARIDEAIDKINSQEAALLGFYQADTEDGSQWHEVYGFSKTAEKKALKDAESLARKIAKDLGVDIGRKKLAKANIAPAGGDISFRIPLTENREIYLNIGIYPDGINQGGFYSDDLKVDWRYFRIEDPTANGYNRYISSNCNFKSDYEYQGLIDEIRAQIKFHVPDFSIKTETKPEQDGKTELDEEPSHPVMDLVEHIENAGGQENGYTITPSKYTTKKGKVLDMQLVKFDNELSKEQQRAANSLARDLKGWWSRDDGGFMMRDEATAKQLIDAVLDESGETLADAAPLSLDDMKSATGESVVVDPTLAQAATQGDDNAIKAQETLDHIQEEREKVNTNPTDGQKEAGNYRKGHVVVDGYDVTIENPKGSQRSGTDAKGVKWSVTMQYDYGYIRGTEGVDGDHIDIFLSDFPTQGAVFVIDQMNPDTGEFDEHKVMYGFGSAEDAKTAYLSNYEDGWDGLGTITEVSKDEFKKWIDSSHRKTKPFSEYKSVDGVRMSTVAADDAIPAGKESEKSDTQDENNANELFNSVSEGDVFVNDNGLTVTVDRKVDGKSKTTRAVRIKWEQEVPNGQNGRNVEVLNVEHFFEYVKNNGLRKSLMEESYPQPNQQSSSSEYGAKNKLVSQSRYEELKRRMQEKLGGQMNMGIDPEILAIGTEMALYHIEAGARKFADFCKNMVADLGDAIRPYLKSFYNGARDLPEVEEAGYLDELSTYDEVKLFDVLGFDKGGSSFVDTAKEAVKEDEIKKQAEEGKKKLVEKRNETNRGKKKSVSSQPSLFDEETEQNTQDNGLQRNDELRTEGMPADDNQPSGNPGGVGGEARKESGRPDSGGESGSTGNGGRPVGRLQGLRNTRNNHAERGTDYAPKSVDARIEANIKAIELMQQLVESGKQATPEDMAVLRQFSGWGGLGKAFQENGYGYGYDPTATSKRLRQLLGDEAYEQANMSRNSAYFTPAEVIDTLWDIARAMGFEGGNVLEGSAGIGNIIGLMPADMSQQSSIHAVEIDQTTGNILSLLYPDAKVEVQGFEATKVENGSVDLAITNVPFVPGMLVPKDTSGDSDLSRKFHNSIQDFCIAKNIRKLRDGGIGIFITSRSTLDEGARLREWIVQDGGADVVGAFRLNNKTFGGTGATSDIIIVRKRVNGRKSQHSIDVSSISGERVAEYETTEAKRNGEVKTVVKQLSMDYNKYFIEHPEMMAGEMQFGFERGDTFRPTGKALYPTKGKDQNQMLADFAKGFEGKEWEAAMESRTEGTERPNVYEELGADVKEGSMVVNSDGVLCVAQRGMAVPLEVNDKKVKGHTKVECFKAYQSIKQALSDVLSYQTENESDGGLQPLLDKLNKAFDSFVKTYGNLHKNTAITFLKNDVDWPNVLALESFRETGDGKGGSVREFGKTDVFKKRVVEKAKAPEPKNVKDGIFASIYLFGRVDVPYISEQVGVSEEDVRKTIVDEGLGFENPATRQMEVTYEYLSGNVREKLQQARDNNTDGRYDANIKALEKVIPMNIPAHLIDFTIGSSWIDPKLYEEFVKERTDIDVRFTAAGGTWFMKAPNWVGAEKNRAMGVMSEMLGKRILGTQLIEAAMQNKTITVSETRKHSDGTTETITDKEATQACATKIDEIRQGFKDWAKAKMQSEPEMSERIERVYNDMFNNYVPLEIPDSFAPEHFAGQAKETNGKPLSMRTHQSKATVRATMQPLLLAHEVGTGKTYTLISIAMEMRRLGTAKKPMIVVQNATVGQFVESAKELYPSSKVLTIEEADRTVEGRKNFYAKIKYNDWDMIIVPQSVFERIPDSDERQMAFVQEKIEEKMLVLEQMRDADDSGNNVIVKQAERDIAELEEEMAGLSDAIAEKRKNRDAKKEAVTRQNAEVKALEMLDREVDDVENFDDMGIDAILVDEAHEYKHLGFATAMQRGVKGVDPSYSKKAQGVFLKTQAVLEKNNGRNVVFATGTPISNTAAEIWTFMRYLMPADTMKQYGIYYFDDFVRNFGNLQQMLEFTTSGKFKENNRFAGYVNLPELVRIWSGVADTVLTKEAGEVKDKIPELEGGKAQDIYLPQTKALRSIMKFVKAELERFEQMSGKQKKENSHIPLVMYGIAKAAAVDARLVDSSAEDDPNSKTNEAVRQTLRSLEETNDYRGTVAIFADLYKREKTLTDENGNPIQKISKKTGKPVFDKHGEPVYLKEVTFNIYEDIKKKLVEAGVPEEQIVVMKSGMSDKKKLEIFEKMNRGEVRVMLGSTFTLGTGVNIQERLHTLIHLDAPNRPMDYTQRNGRILRQGNLHKQMGKPVRVLRFGVEDSLDVTAYQRLKTKGAIADSIMNGKAMMANSMENRVLEEEEDVFGDTVAQLSGSEYAMLKNQAEKDVRKYQAKQKQWEADQTYVHNQIPRLQGSIKAAQRRLEEEKGYLERISAIPEHPTITIGKYTFKSLEEMADFIKEYNAELKQDEAYVRGNMSNGEKKERTLTVNVGGIDFKIHLVMSLETVRKGTTLSSVVKREMTYECPALGLENVPVHQMLLRNALDDILTDVVTGNDCRGNIESAERIIERDSHELEQLKARDGKPFEWEKELQQARERLDEYTAAMKKEMEEKEAKYAEMDSEVEAATGLVEAEEAEEEETPDLSIREEEPPVRTGIGYKVFVLKDGKLYPPMVANPNGEATPVGVWLDADAAPIAGESKTGRPQVKAGGKGTQGGSGQLAYRPGWHLGVIPYAIQFNRKDENGEKTLFPKDFVWAEVEYADDVDYQQEAESYGVTENGKYRHSYAGLPRVPKDGSYTYRTNPNPETDPWIITGAMKVRRILTPSEVDAMVREAGREPQRREEGAITDEEVNHLNGKADNAQQIAFNAVMDALDNAGIEVVMATQEDVNKLKASIRSIQDSKGTVRGWVGNDGRIYLTSDGMSAETPIHEYTHLWAEALQMENPELWEQIKDLLKDTPEWNRIASSVGYKHIRRNEDRLAGEVLAHISGKKNAERMEAEAKRMIDEAPTLEEAAKAANLLGRMRDALKKFWTWVGKTLLGKKGNINIDQVSNMVLADLTNGVDPFHPNNRRHSRRSLSIEDVNERFNEDLEGLSADNARETLLNCGNPSSILLSCGIADKPIRLYGAKLMSKARKHGYKVTDIKDLPKALAHPIAVFIGANDNSYAILTELSIDGKNVLATLSVGKGGHDVDFNIISSVYGKREDSIIHWIINGKLLYVDKEKALGYISDSAPIAEAQYNQGSSSKSIPDALRINLVDYISDNDLNSAAKVIENFENPQIDGENFSDVNLKPTTQDADIESVNRRFNEELQRQIDGTLPQRHIYQLGNAGAILRSAGFPNAPIELASNRLSDKSKQQNHTFELSDIMDLPKALQNPIATFAYGDKSKAQNAIVELTHNGKNFVVGVHFNQNRNGVEVSSIRGLFPKDNAEWLNWITQGKATYIDKEKIQALIDQQRTNLADVEYLDLDSVANILQNFDNPQVDDENFSDVNLSIAEPENKIADEYNRMTGYNGEGVNGYVRKKEKFYRGQFDDLHPLEQMQQLVEKTLGRKLRDSENAYVRGTHLASNTGRRIEKEMLDYLVPALNRSSVFMDRMMTRQGVSRKEAYEMLNDYLLAKHGLERNEWFVKQGKEEGDYAGLRGLAESLGENPDDYKAVAEKVVADFEAEFEAAETKDYWDTMKALTDRILEIGFKCGMTDKDTYESLKGRHKYYVPLRGFADGTSGDLFDYLSSHRHFQDVLKKAQGRTSKADDPLANLYNMLQSAIVIGYQNKELMQPIYNLAVNSKSDLLRVSRSWYVHNATTDEWEERFPDFEGKATADEVDAEMKRFDAEMEQYKAKGEAKQYVNKMELGKRVLPYQAKEHEMTAYINGKKAVIYIAGNPLVAQALNRSNKIQLSEGMQKVQRATRWWSAMNTSWSPAFAFLNAQRDFRMMLFSAYVTGGLGKLGRSALNLFRTTWVVPRLLITGKMDGGIVKWVSKKEAAKLEQWWNEFLDNGGETGFIGTLNAEQSKKEVQDMLRHMLNGSKDGENRVKKYTIGLVEWMGRYSEDISRFAAYCAARSEKGSTVLKSINEAKNSTVNFNVKGGSELAAKCRALHSFFNASMQGINKILRLAKENPKRFAAGVAALLMGGALVPWLNMVAFLWFGGDDDDWEKYRMLSEYTANHNFILYVGNHKFIKLRYSQELAPFNALGNIWFRQQMGWNHGRSVAEQWADMFVEASPISISSGKHPAAGIVKTVMPDFSSLIWEVKFNEDFTASPIYKDNQWNKYDAKWEKAYESKTSKYFIDASKWIYDKTGGNININPATAEHIVSGVLGGLGRSGENLMKYFSDGFQTQNAPYLRTIMFDSKKQGYIGAVNREYGRLAYEVLPEMKHDVDRMDPVEFAKAVNTAEYKITDMVSIYKTGKDLLGNKGKFVGIDKLEKIYKEAEKKSDGSDVAEENLQAMREEINEAKMEMLDAIGQIIYENSGDGRKARIDRVKEIERKSKEKYKRKHGE